jgi:hypothetical protein
MVNRTIARGYKFGSRVAWRRKIIHRDTANPHLYCIGGSGSGKTRLLYHLCIQEIEESLLNPGYQSVVVIDPHGDLHRSILNYIGANMGRYFLDDNVVLIEPVLQDRGSIGLNVLETPPGIHPYETVDEVIACFKTIWWRDWGARMEDILRNSCILLQKHNLTVAHMPRLLTDESFRDALVENCDDRDVTMYWKSHFGSFKKNDRVFFVESTRNKVSQFISNPYLRPILGQQTSTVNFAREMTAGKVVLICLSRDHLKTESRRLFGTLVFAGVHQALLSRNEQREEQRTPTSIYIDEAHEIFQPSLFLNVLEGGRKYKAALNMFHQSLSQLEDDHVDIALGNTATQITFGVARADAERMAKESFTFTGKQVKHQDRGLLFSKNSRPLYFSVQEEFENAVSELMRQKVGQCYIKMKGQSQEPYVSNTFKIKYAKIDEEKEDKLRALSAKYYNKPLEQVFQGIESAEQAAIDRVKGLPAEPVSFRE